MKRLAAALTAAALAAAVAAPAVPAADADAPPCYPALKRVLSALHISC